MQSLLALLLFVEPAPLPFPDPDEDRLGPIVVDAEPVDDDGDPARLPVLAVGTAGPHSAAALPWFRVVRRDLELFGGFELRDVNTDADTWLHGAAAGVVFVGLAGSGGVRLFARVYDRNGKLRWEKPLADAPRDAVAAHALTDAVLDALTGSRGGFASRLTFVRTQQSTQSAWVIDVDGRNAELVSKPNELVVSPAFDSDGRLVYAASVDHGRYRVRVAGDPDAGADLGGSVYGIAFSPDGRRAAVAVARHGGIHLLVGTSRLAELTRMGDVELALHPAFGPGDRIAFVGEVSGRTRVFVGDRVVSSKRASASSPEFCHHAARPRLLWAERTGKRSVLVIADAAGRGATRISSTWGDARWPACSPDGRMIAFVSTGGGHDPGVYVTHVDRFAPRRVSSMVGTSLRWSGWR